MGRLGFSSDRLVMVIIVVVVMVMKRMICELMGMMVTVRIDLKEKEAHIGKCHGN